MKGQTRIMLAVGVGSLGILLLVYASIQASARQYVRIHELTASPDTYAGKRLKLSGEIVEDSVTFNAEKLKLRFKVKDVEGEGPDTTNGGPTEEKPVTEIAYQGPKPDAFKEGGVAIVKGVYDAEKNRIKASNLQAKCPSRYKKDLKEKETKGSTSTDTTTSQTE